MRKLSVAVVLVILVSIGGAAAQTYPSRAITMVVPFPAGGATTVLARVLAEHMRESLGQPVVVENVFGAGGSIGVGRIAHGSPILHSGWSQRMPCRRRT